MIKWLIISVVVFCFFILLLTGFGYLLKENERKNRTYIEQQQRIIKHEVSKQQGNQEKIGSKVQAIIERHLTCTSAKQCKAVNIEFTNQTCTFIVNDIGARQLTGVSKSSSISICPKLTNSVRLVCENNRCQQSSIR